MRLFVMIEPSTNQQSLDVLIQALKNAGVKNFRIYFDKKQ